MKRLVEIRAYKLKPDAAGAFHDAVLARAVPMLREWGTEVVAFGPSAHERLIGAGVLLLAFPAGRGDAMRRILVVAAQLLLALLAGVAFLMSSTPASAKGSTVRIEVRGATLATPLDISDPAIVGKFSIWTGPGVGVNGQPTHLDPDHQEGMFIDWPKGTVTARPPGLESYEVTFHIGDPRPPHTEYQTYVVLYEPERATQQGYIYLPGYPDEIGQANMSAIAHGVERNWFHSSKAWEVLVRPIILASR